MTGAIIGGAGAAGGGVEGLGGAAGGASLGKMFMKIFPSLQLGGVDEMARGFAGAFKEALKRTQEFEKAGGELGSSLMEGFQSVVAGKMPDLQRSFSTVEDGIVHLVETAGMASGIGLPFVAALEVAKPALDGFRVLGGEFIETLTQVADTYQAAARTISASTIDPKNIEILTGSLRDLMAQGEISNLDAAAAAMGRLNANIQGLTIDQLKELTTTFVSAEEIVGRMDETKVAGVFNAFKIGPEQANEELTYLVNAARATGIEVGTLTDQVIRSGPAFRDMGYNAEQTISFFAAMTKEGERGTRLVQGLSALDEHLNKLVAGGVMPSVAAGWAQIIDTVRKYIAAGDEAGAKNFLAEMKVPATTVGLLFEDLRSKILDVPAAMEGLGPGMQAPIRLAEEETMGLEERLAKIGQQFKAALEPVGASFSQALAPIGEHITVWLKEHQEQIAHWAAEAAKIFIDVMGQVGIFLGDAVNAIGPLLEVAKDAVVGFIDFFLNGLELIAKPLSLLPGRFGAPFKDFVKGADEARGALNKAWDFDLPKALDKGDQWLHHFKDDIVPGMMKGLDTGLGKWFKDQHDHPGKADVQLNPKTGKGDDAKDSGDLVEPGSVDITLDPKFNPNVIPGGPGGLPQPAYGGPVPGAPGPVPSAGGPAGPGGGPGGPAAPGAGGARTGVNWDAIAGGGQYGPNESGGNWTIDHGEGTADNPVSGGLQIGDKTWAEHGGLKYGKRAYQATKEQQIEIAEAILADQGPGAWPVTFRNHPEYFGTLTPASPSFPPRVSRLSGGVLDYPAGKAIPALLHGQEYVMPPEQTAKYRRVLDAMRAGTLRSLDNGGTGEGAFDTPTTASPQFGGMPNLPSGAGQDVVAYLEAIVDAYNKANGTNLSISATYAGGPHGGHPYEGGTSQHDVKHAVDVSGSAAEMARFANWWTSQPGMVAITRQLIHDNPNFDPNRNIIGGHFTSGPGTYSGGTFQEHENHIHLAVQYFPADVGTGTGQVDVNYPSGASGNVGGAQTGVGTPGYGPGLGPMGPGGNQYNWARMTPEQAARVEEWQSQSEKTGRELSDAQADLANKTRIRSALEGEYNDLAGKYNHDVEMQGEDLAKQGQNYKDLMAITAKLSQARKEEHDASDKITDLQQRQAVEALKEPDLRKGVKPDKDAEKLGAGLVTGVLQELGFPDVFGKAITQWGIWKLGMGALGYGMSFFFDKDGKPRTGIGAGIQRGAGEAAGLPKNLLDGAPAAGLTSGDQAPFLGPSGGGGTGDGSFFTKPKIFPQPKDDKGAPILKGKKSAYVTGDDGQPIQADFVSQYSPDLSGIGALAGGQQQHSGQLSDFIMGMLPSSVSHPLREPSALASHMTPSRPADKEKFGGLSGPPVVFNNNLTGVMGQKEVQATMNKGIQAGSRLNSIASPGVRMM